MKASELRTENYIQVDDLPIEQVTLDVFATLKELPHTISKFNAIPLTEEWLLKFGFEKSEDLNNEVYYTKQSDCGKLQIKNDIARVHSGLGTSEDYGFEIKLQFVHQLQNLYFALTGEELTIKEPEKV